MNIFSLFKAFTDVYLGSTESVRNQTTVKIEFDDEEQAPYLLPKSVIRGKVVLEKGDDLFRIGEVKIKVNSSK